MIKENTNYQSEHSIYMLQTRSNPTKTLTLDFDYANSIIIWLQWKLIEVQSCDKLKLMVQTPDLKDPQ